MPEEKLVPCPVCGQQIDQAAYVCPYCQIILRQNTAAPVLYPNVTNEPQLKKASPPKQEAKSKSKRPSEKKNKSTTSVIPAIGWIFFSFLVLLILIDFNKYGELIVPASIAFIALRKKKWLWLAIAVIVWLIIIGS